MSGSVYVETGGGGGGGDHMWQQTVETRLSALSGDIKEVRNWIIGLLVVGAGAVIWANGQFSEIRKDNGEKAEAVAGRFNTIEKSQASMQSDLSHMADDIREIKAAVVKRK